MSILDSVYSGHIKNLLLNSELFTKKNNLNGLSNVDGILIPGGFGTRGIDGKINAACFARKNKIPFLGICLGMQIAIIEAARNLANLKDANSTEFSKTKNPVIGIMTEWNKKNKKITRKLNGNMGGTMRLGAYDCNLKKNSRIYHIYKKTKISERHRHRYEINLNYRKKLEKYGMDFSGMSPDGKLPEIVELKNHPWYIGVQFHPELKSRPFDPHPLFVSFIKAAVKRSRLI